MACVAGCRAFSDGPSLVAAFEACVAEAESVDAAAAHGAAAGFVAGGYGFTPCWDVPDSEGGPVCACPEARMPTSGCADCDGALVERTFGRMEAWDVGKVGTGEERSRVELDLGASGLAMFLGADVGAARWRTRGLQTAGGTGTVEIRLLAVLNMKQVQFVENQGIRDAFVNGLVASAGSGALSAQNVTLDCLCAGDCSTGSGVAPGGGKCYSNVAASPAPVPSPAPAPAPASALSDCDASSPQVSGTLGNCTSKLPHGAMCVPTCNTGFYADPSDGRRSCSNGTLSNNFFCLAYLTCDASSPPKNGDVGNCTAKLQHGAYCVPTCNTGYAADPAFGSRQCNNGTVVDTFSCVAVTNPFKVSASNLKIRPPAHAPSSGALFSGRRGRALQQAESANTFAPDAAHIELTMNVASADVATTIKERVSSGLAAQELRSQLASSPSFGPDIRVELTLIGGANNVSSPAAAAQLDYSFPEADPLTAEASTSASVAVGVVVAATVTTSVATSVSASASASALGAAGGAGGGGSAAGSAMAFIGQVQFVSLTSHIKGGMPVQYDEVVEGASWLNMRFDTPDSPSEGDVGTRPGDAVPIMRRRLLTTDEDDDGGGWGCSARNKSVRGMATCGLWRQLYGAAIFIGIIICIHVACLAGHAVGFCRSSRVQSDEGEEGAAEGGGEEDDDVEGGGEASKKSDKMDAPGQGESSSMEAQGLVVAGASSVDASALKTKYGRKIGKKMGLASKAGGEAGLCTNICLSIPILSDLFIFVMNGGLEDALLVPNPEILAILFVLPGVSEAAGGAIATLTGAGFGMGIAMTVLAAAFLFVAVLNVLVYLSRSMQWNSDVRVWVPVDGSDPSGLRVSSLGYQDYVPGPGLMTLAVVLVCMPTRAFAVGVFFIICAEETNLKDLEAHDMCVRLQILVVVSLCLIVLAMLLAFHPMVNRDSERAALACGALNVVGLLSMAFTPAVRGTPSAEVPAIIAITCFVASIVVLVLFEIKKMVAPYKPPAPPGEGEGVDAADTAGEVEGGATGVPKDELSQ